MSAVLFLGGVGLVIGLMLGRAWERSRCEYIEVPPTVDGHKGAVRIDYTNHRGERAERLIVPHRWYWGSSAWHPEPQWLLDAEDVEKHQDRTFALCCIHSWTADAKAYAGYKCE